MFASLFQVDLICEFSKCKAAFKRTLCSERGKRRRRNFLLVFNSCNMETKWEFLVFYLIPFASGCQGDFTRDRESVELKETWKTIYSSDDNF